MKNKIMQSFIKTVKTFNNIHVCARTDKDAHSNNYPIAESNQDKPSYECILIYVL
jgi:hypothetical protein